MSRADRFRYECVIDGCRHTPYSSGFCYRHHQRYVVEDRTR